METFTVKNLTFTYPNKKTPALSNVNFSIGLGEFVVICGQSGSGKSTLLRSFKPVLAPHGERTGEILFYGKDVAGLDRHTQAGESVTCFRILTRRSLPIKFGMNWHLVLKAWGWIRKPSG